MNQVQGSETRDPASLVWYVASKADSLQGLVVDEMTGRNIAVCYDPNDAPLLAAAPKLLSAGQAALEQMEQCLKGLQQDDDFKQAFADLREAISDARSGWDVDWYRRRDELRPGMIFETADGVVKLDRRVPGDGTKWYVADRSGATWSYCDNTIEPGALIGQPRMA